MINGSLLSRILCIALILVLLTSHSIFAQNSGIAGIIKDGDTGEPLPGANVILSGTSIGTASLRNGEFRISPVPSGSYSLEVSYLGYESYSAQIDVSDDETDWLKIELKAVPLEGETVVVSGGQRTGQARALNQQRTALNIVNVVAADQIDRFPDPNVAEALQRIPSVAIQRDQGEGRYVVIRGTEPSLSAVMINGERIPSPEGDIRNVALDVIPADQLNSIEVSKTLTPDMDADAIGGSIDLKTKSALDYDHRIVKIKLGGGYNDISGGGIGTGSFTYGTRLGEKRNLGIVISGSYLITQMGSDNDEIEWDNVDFEQGGSGEVVANLEMRDYTITRDRLAFSTNLDYAWSKSSKNYLRFIFNNFGDQEYRRRFRIRFDKGDFISPGRVEGAAVERELKDRYEVQRIWNVSSGGIHTVMDGSLDLDYNVSFSHAEEQEPDRYDHTYEYEDDVNLDYDLSNHDTPQFNPDPGVNLDDPSKYILSDIVYSDNLTTDDEISIGANAKYRLDIMEKPAWLKFGLKSRMKSKERDNNVIEYGAEDDFYLSDYLDDFRAKDFLDGEYDDYEIALTPDPDKGEQMVKDYGDDPAKFEKSELYEDTDASNYDAKENVTAGYLMGTVNLNPQWILMAGLRLEITDLEYNGSRVTYDANGDYSGTVKASGSNDYTNALPMLHLRYKLNPSTNLRFAWTNSLARPNYYDLVPYELRNNEDEEIERGNPSLDPTTSMNIDLLGEHYFQSLGIFSAGVFYKMLDKHIYTRTFEQNIGGIDYEVTQPVNGDDAILYGFELAWNQQLTFLPGWMNGFGIYTNYTFTDSETEFLWEGGDDPRTSVIPGQSKNMMNASIGYEKYGFSGRISLNFAGEQILEVGKDADHDQWITNHTQIDFTASQQIWRTLKVYLDVNNLANEPYVVYEGDENHPIQREFYSWWVRSGLKYSF